MLKFLFKVLFKPSHRPRAKANNEPVKDARPSMAGSGIIESFEETTTAQLGGVAQGAAFDAATAHSVKLPVVLEGPAYVIDGDTITIQKTQVRLWGIDAPELNHPYGKNAKWALMRLCKGHTLRAELTDEDAYGRTVAKCFLPDGRDLSEELVKQGLAIDWPKFSGGKYSHLEVAGIRKKLWLADARQRGRMDIWEKFEVRKKSESKEK
jgi:micrococcal nuclease